MGSVTAGRARSRQRRARPHRLRWRPAGPHGDDQPHQRLVAAGVGRHDAGRCAGATPRTTRRTIITPFILAGAMAPSHQRRRGRADPGRSAGRHDLHAAGAPGRTGRLRVVRQLDEHADRRPHVRHARAGDGALHGGRARPPPRCAVPLRRFAHRLEAARRAGRVRERQHAAADGARWRQLRAARCRLAGGWPRHRLREVRARLRPAGHDDHVRAAASTCQRERAGARRAPQQPARQPLPRHRAHARQLRDRVLPQRHGRQLAASSSGARRAASTPPSAPTRCGSAGSPSTRRRRSTTRSTKSCWSSSPAARPNCPTSSPELHALKHRHPGEPTRATR